MDEKKAEDILILDMRKLISYCDYFVICSANSERQVRAVANYVDEQLHEQAVKISFRQGVKQSNWVIYDTGDVVLHVFQNQIREFYKLEYLWRQADHVNWKPSQTAKKKNIKSS